MELHCLGGFVAKVLYGLKRETADVDILSVATNSKNDAVLKLGIAGARLHKEYGCPLEFKPVNSTLVSDCLLVPPVGRHETKSIGLFIPSRLTRRTKVLNSQRCRS